MTRACTPPLPSPRSSSHDLSRIALFLTLTALWIFISWPIFQGRLGYHDLAFTPQRFISLADGMGTAFPVYLYPGFSFDYGYPTGVFYPDKFLYPFALLVHHEWLTYIQAVQLYVLCRNAAVILISFYSFHHIFQSRWVAFFGCVLYSSSIWHLSNIYVRLATGEFTAMVFLPLLAAGIYDLRRSRTWSSIFLLAIGYTGLISSHVITTLLATCCLALYALIEWRVLLVKNFGLTTKAAFVTLLCNIGFIVPFLSWIGIIYGRSLGYDALFPSSATVFRSIGAYFPQLFAINYNTLGAGHLAITPPAEEMHIGVGVALLTALVASLTLLFYVFYIYAVNMRNASPERNAVQQDMPIRPLTITSLLAFLTLWFSTIYFPWDALEKYMPILWWLLGENIQFPWRWMTCSTLLLTLLAMQSLSYLNSKQLKTNSVRPARRFLAITMYATAIMSLSLWQSTIFITRVIQESQAFKNMESNVERPVGDDGIYRLKGSTSPEKHNPQNNHIVPSSIRNINITNYERSGFRFTLRAKNTSKTSEWLDFPVWNYPGYKAVSSKGEKLGVADGDNRRVRVYLPPGFNNTLTLRWVAPWHWRVAHIVSLVSLIALLLFVFTPLPRWLARHAPRLCGFAPHSSAPW